MAAHLCSRAKLPSRFSCRVAIYGGEFLKRRCQGSGGSGASSRRHCFKSRRNLHQMFTPPPTLLSTLPPTHSYPYHCPHHTAHTTLKCPHHRHCQPLPPLASSGVRNPHHLRGFLVDAFSHSLGKTVHHALGQRNGDDPSAAERDARARRTRRRSGDLSIGARWRANPLRDPTELTKAAAGKGGSTLLVSTSQLRTSQSSLEWTLGVVSPVGRRRMPKGESTRDRSDSPSFLRLFA